VLSASALVIVCAPAGTAGPGAQHTPANWLTDGADSRRTAWQQNETILTTANATDMKLLWKIKLDNLGTYARPQSAKPVEKIEVTVNRRGVKLRRPNGSDERGFALAGSCRHKRAVGRQPGHAPRSREPRTAPFPLIIARPSSS
jgi:hypothetical protein